MSLQGCSQHANFKALKALEYTCPHCGYVGEVFNDEAVPGFPCEQCGEPLAPRHCTLPHDHD